MELGYALLDELGIEGNDLNDYLKVSRIGL
jgi:hypothetical protein